MTRAPLLALLLLLLGCRPPEPEPELIVFAASSLTEALRDLAPAFEATHPGVQVRLSFAGSQVLRLQLEQGARADLFASASEPHMQALRDAGLAGAPQILATNELLLIAPLHNPAGLERFEDLPQAQRLVVGRPEVPVGAYTEVLWRRSAEALGPAFSQQVRAHIVSREGNVRLVRAKVELGVADAAIVYRSDVSERVLALPIPRELSPRARYPIALLRDAPQPELAAAFLAFLRSAPAREILAARGFSPGEP